MVIYNIYDQVADLIASLPVAKVMGLRPTPELTNRFNELSLKNKSNTLSIIEKDELDHFVVLERLIRLAKIRSQKVEK